MIAVQEITTVWSKHSRSRGKAGLRNRVPTSFPLPKLQTELPNQILYQQCVFGEVDDFQENRTHVSFVALTSPTILECTHLDLSGNELVVKYFYNYKTGGAPARTYIDSTGTIVPECKKAFILLQGEWGRMRHNRRYTLPLGYVGDEGAWYYEQTTVNIGFLKSYNEAFFTSSNPNFEYDKLAHLW